jgi:hypothetical protein
MSGEIGPLFSAYEVEEAVLAALMRRLPLYSTTARQQWGVKLPEIASWGLVDEDEDRWPEQALPALVVIADETRNVEEHADGWYRATWPFSVTVAIEHPERVWARKIAQIYGAVIQAALLQRRSLGQEGMRLEWLGQKLPFRAEQSRTEAVSQNLFAVVVDEVVNWQNGPKDDSELPQEPPGSDPEVTEIEVDVEVKDR